MNTKPLTRVEELRALRSIRFFAERLLEHETVRLNPCKDTRKTVRRLDHALAIYGLKTKRKRAWPNQSL